ncbi:DUF3035 domain-containing protein [Marivivens donghaensis]|uniref:DUF3035 domain-containing protein n=1 Tax=Marivivens donghaensis TaxID=1699413 RepID=UPI00201F7660|nr:DUF3035 domain-containing protein [Marivivens donghaensis]MCL7408770.1 DUF3035 domain-containing protein [Marivivens donghaensis]MDN3703187.1 DUF3035 domain-containing protein [Marivivens donghaensis]
MRGLLLALCAALTLSACGGGERTLHRTSLTDGSPDEFGVQPTRTLELPQSMNLLPTPTPGGVNLADANPQADAIAVLGGSVTGGVGGDAALMAQVSRFGVDPSIRSVLAAEDAAFRKRRTNLSLFRIFNRDRYFQAYRGQSLDAYAQLERFRSLGAAVPSAPPAN